MDPILGTMEEPRSVMADKNASQLIDPWPVDDGDKRDEKMVKVDGLTLNSCCCAMRVCSSESCGLAG